ncbi:MAG: hypothetical protein LBP22_16495 [Deltaproteobacteria bacterium]|jgi:hypothetical protein|nr:hypothetical protein [Deltaproteobacteria bacterium]
MFATFISLTQKKLISALAVLVAAALLTGCAGQKLGKQTVTVKHYPECYRPISDLRKSAEAVNKATAAGAVLGAIAGAAIGYAESGNSRGAVIGAISGGLAGAGLGYLISNEVQSQAMADRFRTYFEAMDMDTANLKQAVAAARIASNCYDKQYQQLNRDYQRGRIGKPEMLERLTEIRQGSEDAYTILKNYADASANTAKTYDELIRIERTRPDRASQAMINTITRKKVAYNTQARTLDSSIALLERRKNAVARSHEAMTTEKKDGLPATIVAGASGLVFVPCTY